jgi:hypothetical protein
MDDRFKKAEDEYFRLKGQLAAGRIAHDQFEAGLEGLMIQDAQGRYWMLGSESAKWNVYDGAKWVEADPFAAPSPASPPRPTDLPRSVALPRPQAGPNFAPPPSARTPVQYAAPPPAKSGMGCGGCLLRSCLLILVLAVIVAVGGFLAFRTGALSPQAALSIYLNITGQGPADIEVENFRDDAIAVSIQQTDAAKDANAAEGSLALNAFDVRRFRAPNPGKYRVSFTAAGSSDSALGTCMLTLRSGDRYQFVTLPDKIVVNRVNNPSNAGTDFVVDSSSLCR